jgi:hypothetical protein
MKRCTFKQGKFHCGSYAFNLYNEDIAQGNYCDHHYWQDQAQKARADEREACANDVRFADNGTEAAAIIRARGQE